MSLLTQENRTMVIGSVLSDIEESTLVLTEFSGTEAISRPFSFELGLVSERNDISFQDIIGTNVTVSIALADGNFRFFNGIISRFMHNAAAEEAETSEYLAHYSATMVPWLWLLTLTKNSRIFQSMSVPEIVETIFIEKGFSDFRIELNRYEPKEYCVQYAETDFNFISRLLEQEGIFYFFEHENGKHTMVIADSSTHHKDCPHQEDARFHPISDLDEDVITELNKMQELRVGKYTVNDFNFETPLTDLKVDAASQVRLGSGEREWYSYPAEYGTRAEGERIANIRMQAEEARITTLSGTSCCRAFTPGYKFFLSGHYRDELNNKPYVLTSVSHHITEPAGGSLSDMMGMKYTNRFTCIPFDVPYRPPLLTEKPLISGVQTAIVVGPKGEEIYTDKYGRIKVQFPWDREGKYDENSSCWIRVSQTWAGSGWGTIYIPRVGQEVLVEFIESDPDRPIVTGSVYNGINMPPYSLPDEKTKASLKSMSSPEGNGFNEIRFEDKDGKEQIFIHAENAHDVRVKGTSREFVGGKRHLIVEDDQLEKVKGDKHLAVLGDHNEAVTGTISVRASGDVQTEAGNNYAIKSGMEIHINGGVKVVMEAGMQLSLKAGASFIDIGPAGISIQGPLVNINSGGAPAVGAGCFPQDPLEPEEADVADPGQAQELHQPPSKEEIEKTSIAPNAVVFKNAAKTGTPFCEL